MQKFKKWVPIMVFGEDLGVRGLYDDIEGFRVLLANERGKVISIKFDAHLAYYNTNESYCFDRTICNEETGPFYIIDNSDLKQSFIEGDVVNLFSPEEIVHYAIYTGEDCIDVLSIAGNKPIASWLN